MAVLSLFTAVGTLLGVAIHRFFPIHFKHHTKLAGWQRTLGELLESKPFVLVVVIAILADLTCTATVLMQEEGEAVEWAEKIGFGCLVGFFAEQVPHVLAFGMLFFCNPWFVIDMLAVSLSIAIELKEETWRANPPLSACGLFRAVASFLKTRPGKELLLSYDPAE